MLFFFKQKTAYEILVTGVQTCALPISRDGLPTPQAHVVLVPLLPVPERERTDARVDPAPRRDGGNRLGVGAGEEQALVGERVEVGRLYPVVAVGPDVVLPQAVD